MNKMLVYIGHSSLGYPKYYNRIHCREEIHVPEEIRELEGITVKVKNGYAYAPEVVLYDISRPIDPMCLNYYLYLIAREYGVQFFLSELESLLTQRNPERGTIDILHTDYDPTCNVFLMIATLAPESDIEWAGRRVVERHFFANASSLSLKGGWYAREAWVQLHDVISRKRGILLFILSRGKVFEKEMRKIVGDLSIRIEQVEYHAISHNRYIELVERFGRMIAHEKRPLFVVDSYYSGTTLHRLYETLSSYCDVVPVAVNPKGAVENFVDYVIFRDRLYTMDEFNGELERILSPLNDRRIGPILELKKNRKHNSAV